MQLPIIREHAQKDRERHKTGIGLLNLTFTAIDRAVYLGDKYKFLFSKDLDCFQLQSTSPISLKSLPKNIDLKTLIVQRT